MRPHRRPSPRLRKIAADLYRPDHMRRGPAPKIEIHSLADLLDAPGKKNAPPEGGAAQVDVTNLKDEDNEYPLDRRNATG